MRHYDNTDACPRCPGVMRPSRELMSTVRETTATACAGDAAPAAARMAVRVRLVHVRTCDRCGYVVQVTETRGEVQTP